MGANNSTRKITLVNDDTAGVLKFSESLAHRLRGELEKNSEVKSVVQKVEDDPKPLVQEKQIVEEHKSTKELKSNASPTTESGVHPLWVAYSQDSHSLISRLKEENDIALDLKYEEWRKRIKEREEEYISINKLSTEELSKAVKDTEYLFTRPSCTSCCQTTQESVYKCYKDNSSQPLRCAQEVGNFVRCVDSYRLQDVSTQ